jgi:acetyl esterase
LPPLQSITDEAVDGPNGPIPVRRYVPMGDVLGRCVYFHSGGWVLGDLSSGDALCRRLAGAARYEMINVDYRLAPEHPYPAPLDDAYAVVAWAARTLPGPLLVAGESAGGNLAAAVAIRARDTGGPALAGQVLAYPVTDAGMQTESYRENGDRKLLLSAADMAWFWDHYCPAHVDRRHELVAPLHVPDPAGLPPTLLIVAELDPLRDEGLAYADRLAQAGVSTEIRRDAGMLHGYLNAAGAVSAAADAVAQAAAWMIERPNLHDRN